MTKEITPQMLADIEWIHTTLLSIKGRPELYLTKEVVGKSLEFAKGAHWARENFLKEKLEYLNKQAGIIAKLRADLDQVKGMINGS